MATECHSVPLMAVPLLPVHLQTVCSGTDAPALALQIVSKELQEQGLSLQVHHALSCEKEPFKQAYIARNFPGVALFNDVVELAASSTASLSTKVLPRASTSFGGERAIPQAPQGHLSVLIAGTSCKDFSARKRAGGIKLDIEDMGTSGETFLATIDYLFASAHDICLLENVTSAPWAKMQGYITGRVMAKDIFSKIQSSAKSQGEKVVDTTKKGAVKETVRGVELGVEPPTAAPTAALSHAVPALHCRSAARA
jgi:site-specific DNA-cytosine methylase